MQKRCGPLHVGSRVKFQETEKRKVSFMDLITLLKRIQPTGPQGEAQFEGREVVQGRGHGQGCGRGRGRGRGAQLPNQLLTSPETVEFFPKRKKRWRQSKSL